MKIKRGGMNENNIYDRMGTKSEWHSPGEAQMIREVEALTMALDIVRQERDVALAEVEALKAHVSNRDELIKTLQSQIVEIRSGKTRGK
jgi:hypothetical protein